MRDLSYEKRQATPPWALWAGRIGGLAIGATFIYFFGSDALSPWSAYIVGAAAAWLCEAVAPYLDGKT